MYSVTWDIRGEMCACMRLKKCVLHIRVYVYTCGNTGITAWFSTCNAQRDSDHRSSSYQKVEERKGQNAAGSFEGRNSVDTSRNHTTQQETDSIQDDSEPK